jgi:hypothetical protein
LFWPIQQTYIFELSGNGHRREPVLFLTDMSEKTPRTEGGESVIHVGDDLIWPCEIGEVQRGHINDVCIKVTNSRTGGDCGALHF